MGNSKTLGVGFIGSGFITRFHIESWVAVRDADVLGVWSPNKDNAQSAAGLAQSLGVGDAQAFDSITDMVADPAIDCIWLCGPNHRRIENMEEIVAALDAGKGELVGIACEKPLGRNVAEARRMLELAEKAGLLHGYLENQLFSPSLARGREIAWKRGAALAGRPYLARAAEEHGGPHMPWFWQGEMQGGGVLNDMMCHSVEVARFLLTEPGTPRDSIRPVKVTGHIASLKWTRPEYIRELKETYGADVDYAQKPAEDFASVVIEFRDSQERILIAETTTSWSYVGAGLRISAELLGPEYMMQVNTLDTSGKVFFSRHLKSPEGEDLLEKQNAEQGLMPIVGNEAFEYGYQDENRSFVQSFLRGEQPAEGFDAGLEVTELLMSAYMSAEQERTIAFRPDNLDEFVPAVATGTWKP